MHLDQNYGPYTIIAILFIVIGAAMWINIVWGLISGGPRAVHEPGAPYLYDRLYYMLYGLGLLGWTWCMFSVFSIHGDEAPFGFLIGWGIGALGIGLWFLLRGDMFIRGMDYRRKHGIWFFRMFYRTQDFNRLTPLMRKLLASVFIIAGIGVFAFNLTHLSAGIDEARTGAENLLKLLAP